MATGKWWVVWSGKNVGVTHAARKPKGIAQGPFPSKIAAFRAGRRALLRYRVSGQGPNPPKRRRKKNPYRQSSALGNYVKFGEKALASFRKSYPASGIPSDLPWIAFQFDAHGDLVDIVTPRGFDSADFDGAGLSALADDAKRNLKNPGQGTPGREVALMVQRAGATGFWQFGDSIGIRTTVGADRKTFNVIKWYRLVNGKWEFAGSADGVRAGAVFVPLGKFLRTNPSKRLKLSGKMKTVKTPSPADNWAWYENDVGTHIDSAFGPDHVIRKMEGLLAATASGIREEDEAIEKLQHEVKELRGSETREASQPEFLGEWLEDATRVLQAHTADGLVWLWDAGDLLLVNAEQVLDNPRRKVGRRNPPRSELEAWDRVLRYADAIIQANRHSRGDAGVIQDAQNIRTIGHEMSVQVARGVHRNPPPRRSL